MEIMETFVLLCKSPIIHTHRHKNMFAAVDGVTKHTVLLFSFVLRCHYTLIILPNTKQRKQLTSIIFLYIKLTTAYINRI